MREKKAGCSRMALYNELGNHNIFTFETSFSGPSVDMDPHNKLIHFDTEVYQNIGRDFGKALFIFYEEFVTGKKIHRDLSEDELYSNSDDDINSYLNKMSKKKLKQKKTKLIK
jgi:hypothetical protein